MGDPVGWQTTVPETADPRILAVLAYWDGKRGSLPYPSRADVDPTEIPRLLEFVMLVEVRPDEPRFVYRLVGTTIAYLLRRDVTGMPVGTGLKPDALPSVLARYAFVADHGLPAYHRTALQEDRNDYTPVERLLLPLGPRSGPVNMILGMVIPQRRA